MKKFLMSLMIVFMAVSMVSVANAASAATEVQVYFNGEQIQFDDAQPAMIDGRTLVPFRKLFETLGFNVKWSDALQRATGTKGNLTIQLTINSTQAKVNGKLVSLDVPSQIVNNSTMVPLRFVSENSGYEVTFNSIGSVSTINIWSGTSGNNGGSSTNIKTTPVSLKGKKMAIVGRTGGKAEEDNAVAKRFMVLGMKVTLVDEKQATVKMLKEYDIVYFSPTVNEKYVKDGQMKGLDVPQIYGKRQGMAGIRLAPPPDPNNTEDRDEDPDDNTPASEKIRSITFKDSKHPIAAGFSGKVEIFRKVDEEKEKMTQLSVGGNIPIGKNAKVIATVAGQPDKPYIYVYEKGSKADDGTVVPARIAYAIGNIGFHKQLTENGWKILNNIVIWALQKPEQK
ncbi:copper amine oxidase N-terminal domain-containing protein [Paenibacillus alkalitolerans]|uniref:copper amine oxidase N-terminal domain-containing protein n=1 Tax=Paenibacillus alkalitolerans TaxID=2799335 RepID=UPI002D805F5A|nr:copper amine oxidase N-terminal domain-containing protein [Paenibacillus alkalitolerans]